MPLFTKQVIQKPFTKEVLKKQIADSIVVYKRGENIFSLGSYYLKEFNVGENYYHYVVDGNYGDYDVKVRFDNGGIKYSCDCPYHSDGCKHTVAVCLDIISQRYHRKNTYAYDRQGSKDSYPEDEYITYEEIKKEALDRRHASAKNEKFQIVQGETYKGEHLLINAIGKQFVVTMHDPISGKGHCSCSDFCSNRLGICKHIIYVNTHLKKQKKFSSKVKNEKFPFVHVYWDSIAGKPIFFYDRELPADLKKNFSAYFNEEGLFKKDKLSDLYHLVSRVIENKNVKVDGYVLQRINNVLFEKEIQGIRESIVPDLSCINASLYPYQREGVSSALLKRSVILADEMGLGKTLQAVTLAILKKELFNFNKVLIITPASLKEQWRLEIERFTHEKVIVISGTKNERQEIYKKNQDFFKITNYEAVLRDILAIRRFNPDLVILDEAQRIKNFETKTSDAVKSIPHKQSIVITGTPLENKLEDLYSIVQFADFEKFTPLWEFAARHFIIKKDKKNKIMGYKNLDTLHTELKDIVIRRKREEVMDDLPEQVTNNYYLDLTKEQYEIHQGYARVLLPLLNKKFLTPIDVRRIQELLALMRMVCNSTYLIDRKTNLSPKLQELEVLLHDIVIENSRKVVIFSEWTTMTFLIGKVLSEMGIPFVEFTGKIPVNKRQKLINEFRDNPDCKVFLSTDAGGLGLNLQAADCVINFELPWNPAKLNQRIGRVLRIGQKSKCVNVVNLVAKNSIEENILAGINLKQELFCGVFDGATHEVIFSREKKIEFINKIREMLKEEPVAVRKDASASEDIPDGIPGYLNPKVIEERALDIAGEEDCSPEYEDAIPDEKSIMERGEEVVRKGDYLESPELVEDVLENGVKFLSGLMSMATGRPLEIEKDKKMISIDRTTGEVTLRFKFPGWQQ